MIVELDTLDGGGIRFRLPAGEAISIGAHGIAHQGTARLLAERRCLPLLPGRFEQWNETCAFEMRGKRQAGEFAEAGKDVH